MPWWQTLLVVAPLSLIFIGGLIGGVIGGSASVINIQIARRQNPPITKTLVMLGVVFAAYVVFFVLYAVLVAALRPTG